MNVLRDISDACKSYQDIITLYGKNRDQLFNDIHIKIEGWFSANMSAVLGAVLDLFSRNINNIQIFCAVAKTEEILLKNDFLSYYGRRKIFDTNHTTIKYQKLKPSDGKYFKKYIIEELIGRDELPNMSVALKEKIVEAIYEIFVNAQIHSGTDFIYTCGQFFPKKNKIEFTIVDTGIGFKEKVNRRFNTNLSAVQAIKWAVKDKKTTKEEISGGIGLAILKEFIGMNKGKMQIISNEGFYQYNCTGVIMRLFNGQFPGTIVNLQFCTDDCNAYSLKNEVDISDIF